MIRATEMLGVALMALALAGCEPAIGKPTARNPGPELVSGNRYLASPEIVGLYAVQPRREPLTEYAACFTFQENRRPGTRAAHTKYFFNGVLVGEDRPGFLLLIEKLRGLPISSIVAAYPHLPTTGNWPAFDEGLYPFDADWGLLDQVARERQLKIIFCYLEPAPPRATGQTTTGTTQR